MEKKSKVGIYVLIGVLLILVLGLSGYIVFDKMQDNNNENKTENTVVRNDEKQYDEDKNSSNTSNVEQSKAKLIMDVINKKEYLKQYSIEENKIGYMDYIIVKNDSNPVYLVAIEHTEKDSSVQHGTVLQFYVENNTVKNEIIEDTKYLSEHFDYSEEQKVLKLSAEYHAGARIALFDYKNGKFIAKSDDNEKGIKYTTLKKNRIISNGYIDNAPEITKEQALQYATKAYKDAYNAVYELNGERCFINDNTTNINGKIASYKVNYNKLTDYFTYEAMAYIVNLSYITKYQDEYYIVDNFLDFLPGIFGATNQGIRPLTVTSFTKDKIIATGQITEGDGDKDSKPLTIEFKRYADDTWKVSRFE